MSIIAAGTTTTTALSSTGNTDGTLQLQVNGTTPSVTLNTLGAIGVGSSPSYGTSGQVLVSAGSTAAPAWTTNVSSQWTTSGSNIYYNTGSVGIGTSSPTRQLSVVDSSNTTDFQLRLGQAANSGNNSYDIGRNTSSTGYLTFYGNQSGGNGYSFGGVNGTRMVIDTSGNVGIGTSSPSYKLHVRGDDATANLVVGNTTEGTQFEVLTYQDDKVVLRSTDSSNVARTLAFQTGTTERLQIASTGAFGLSGANYGTSGQVLTSGGSGAAPTWTTISSSASLNTVVFYSSTTWTVPTGVTSIYCDVVGGGGGAATASNVAAGGGGWASGAISVSAGQVLTITVGNGGTGGQAYGQYGVAGGTSSIVRSGSTLMSADGGSGAGANQGNGSGGYGSGGNSFNVRGGNGITTPGGGSTGTPGASGRGFPVSAGNQNGPGCGGFASGNSYGTSGSAGFITIQYVG